MFKIFFLFLFFFQLHPSEIQVSVGQIFKNGNDISDNEIEKILKLTKKIIRCTISEDTSCLLKSISKKKGVYIDLKAFWTYEEMENEISKEDSYFKLFFFDSKKLKSYSNNQDSRAVKEILLSSNGIILDIFFDSDSNVELNLKFKNPEFEKDLNNPYFIKEKSKWYLYRFF